MPFDYIKGVPKMHVPKILKENKNYLRRFKLKKKKMASLVYTLYLNDSLRELSFFKINWLGLFYLLRYACVIGQLSIFQFHKKGDVEEEHACASEWYLKKQPLLPYLTYARALSVSVLL